MFKLENSFFPDDVVDRRKLGFLTCTYNSSDRPHLNFSIFNEFLFC